MYLVTGGAGFIGSNIVRECLERGISVRILDNFSTGHWHNLEGIRSDVEIVEGDLRSYHLVQKAMRGVEVVLHQGALPSVPRSIDDPITTNEVNVQGTLNVLHAALDEGVRRVTFASSSSIYGNAPQQVKSEDLHVMPLSPYAVSKLAGEKYMQVFHSIYGLETVALRYFNVFGPWQDPDSPYSAVIPLFARAYMEGRAPTINGDGEQSRDFTYVANVVHANLLAAEAADATVGHYPGTKPPAVLEARLGPLDWSSFGGRGYRLLRAVHARTSGVSGPKGETPDRVEMAGARYEAVYLRARARLSGAMHTA